ncbi:aminotransferase class IV family protein [Streptomyces sp. NPDC087658]|uniref:aminotransferase class IV family protein n=1 Tax=Streptomyces sp. NPDC087658 TaxID=3365800 RepID=UPI0038115F89
MAELNGKPVGVEALQSLALTNYGHFTSMRVEDGRVRGLSLHMERLQRDCETLFGAELDPERVRDLARRAVPSNGAAVVRVTVFDPDLDLGHPGSADAPRVLVTSRPAAGLPLPPIRVRSRTYTRDLPGVKSVGLFSSLHHRRTAQLDGFDDALFVDGRGAISEGGTWNIGFFDGDQVIWPESDCLPGVTMRLLQHSHAHVTRPVNLADLPRMRAAFATNAAVGVRAVSGIDTIVLPETHPVIDALRKEYLKVPGELL